MDGHSGKNQIMQYSFLHVFANDRTIDSGELAFMENLALRDHVVDVGEQAVLRAIFARVTAEMVTPDVWVEMQMFRQRFGF